MSQKNKHLGSDFDDFLKEDGLLVEATQVAEKRVESFKKDLRDLRGKFKFEGYSYKVMRGR